MTWDSWKQLVAQVETWGFYGLYRSDHFVMPSPSHENSLEMIVSLTYAADHTRRAYFGPVVAPVSFRDPVMLARQAAQIDALSQGRMVLGVGAGWMAREHEMFGYPLLDTRARMERFAEGLYVVWSLLKSDEPVTFEGRWYSLREAEILPRPYKTRILVGGNGQRKTMPLAAKYADVWNGVGISPSRFSELAAVMDNCLYDAGRAPGSLKKTVATFLYYGRDDAALEQRIARLRTNPELRELPLRDVLAMLHRERNSITGLAEEVIPQIKAYADAGVQELLLQILDSDDIEGIASFADQVMPHVS
jgi:alkanesulfonate monooxygenase SsuD/methylene tetrahydromethanopterin reductase-like flavin-dependent oxidoreductase (luciferase family)